ncbi:MAG: TetR/AcrR family transcriptional regulator C-terminal domain-containing protein [Lachnospiraceae bacterium]|nr:TetR/AcrR family transcriptional regulator C-terminal domain-containing protein [Lachnospiraceae bacterium]
MMSDACSTKNALAKALRELMSEQPFEKITIFQICERCNINRKSFYYHFRDKYDLVNWIFDTDFIALSKKRPDDLWVYSESVCSYLYENRVFYRKALQIEGQNSFSEHFHDIIYPLLSSQLKEWLGMEDIHPMCINFLADGLLCSLKRWLLERNCMPPEQFVSLLKTIVEGTAVAVYREMNRS